MQKRPEKKERISIDDAKRQENDRNKRQRGDYTYKIRGQRKYPER